MLTFQDNDGEYWDHYDSGKVNRSMSKKKIWIDITNSPHVLFFEPLVRELERDGIHFFITSRDYQQTIGLLKQKNLTYESIGKHYGKAKIRKFFGLLHRSFLLWEKVVRLRKEIIFSISHGSPYCSIASKFAKIYNLWTLDGDKAINVIVPGVKFADKVIIPQIVPKENYIKMGSKESKIIRYPGLKEEVYLWDFKPDREYLKKIGIETSRKIILIRPEASKAIYYDKEVNFLTSLINELKNDYFIILIPRTEDQRVFYKNVFGNKIFIPAYAIDGPNSIINVSLVISAGGTMNREAVVMGKKVISTYRGELLTVDKWLIEKGYMLHNINPDKEYVENVVNGDVPTKTYRTSNKTFAFFIDLMRKEIENALSGQERFK